MSTADVEREWQAAETIWEDAQLSKWKLVRGKWIIGSFVSTATNFRGPDSFVKAVLARRPEIAEVKTLENLIMQKMR
jgi:hypothetical protein